MFHIPIVNTKKADNIIEFCHINTDAVAGAWKKENLISLQNIKINIFVEGDFSVFVDGISYGPIYGDVCVFPPYKVHSGQILKPTHTDYYQLNIGPNAFENAPLGNELLNKLISFSKTTDTFFKPEEGDIKKLINLCNKIENAISAENMALAYAYVIVLVSGLCDVYLNKGKVTTFFLSCITKKAVKYLEENFDNNITVSKLSKNLEISSSYLSRLFKKEIGMGIHEYLNKYRITKASYLLQMHSVTEVCYMCGFNDSSHFISVFKKYFGITPMQYKKDRLKKVN